jgi:D-alanyl-lipoteichoic acid acyltransferase DltB (MBOAT superfamily)
VTITTLLILVAAALLLGILPRGRARTLAYLSASVLAIFILQPVVPIRGMDFWLPTTTLALTVLVWSLYRTRAGSVWRENWPAISILVGIVLILAAGRNLGLDFPMQASRTPSLLSVILAILCLFSGGVFLTLSRKDGRIACSLAVVILLVLFTVLKVPALSLQASQLLRSLNQQSIQTASSLDLRWLGFSYIAFRLLHVLRDRQTGRTFPVSLDEFIVYVIFFPTLAAGPIDRLERFIKDLHVEERVSSSAYLQAGWRILLGLFKKFVLADSLAMISLNASNATQVTAAGWTWVMLYAYACQIFFDFSGYTDLALGMGQLLGVKLPENFNRPLSRTNLTQFWNNWHMTLTQWFRAYFFNPLTRSLRTSRCPLPMSAMILITQVSTMVLIGLWHGVTWNFVLWGLWHGAGLFVHNRWAEWRKTRPAVSSPAVQRLLNGVSLLATFHYVALGWVFFALPDLSSSLRIFALLFGGGGS